MAALQQADDPAPVSALTYRRVHETGEITALAPYPAAQRVVCNEAAVTEDRTRCCLKLADPGVLLEQLGTDPHLTQTATELGDLVAEPKITAQRRDNIIVRRPRVDGQVPTAQAVLFTKDQLMRLAADLNQSRAAALNVVSDRRGLLQRPAQFRDDLGNLAVELIVCHHDAHANPPRGDPS